MNNTKKNERIESDEELFQRGMNAQKSKKHKQAFECFLKAATLGHAEAQYALGLMYWQGKGTTKKFTEAFKWISKAAEQGNMAAAADLGFLYRNGIGVGKNNTRALQWYQTAAENGNVNGQFNYGYMFFSGNGVKQDFIEALKWFKKAAEQDHIEATYYTGLIYEEGYGVDKDLAQAKTWYEKGAAAGNKDCQNGLKRVGAEDALEALYKLGKAAYDAQDYDKAQEYLSRATCQHHAGAEALMGCMYMEGKGVARSYGLARYYLEKAEAKGYEGCKEALERLSKAEESAKRASIKPGEEWFNRGMAARGAKNYAQALEYFLKAAEQGHTLAQSWLGWMYCNGQGTAKNYPEAVKWLSKAAAQGHLPSTNNLGYLYRNGLGVAKSDATALHWYRKAAEKGEVTGLFNYAFMLYNGYGTTRNYNEALIWFTKAAEKNKAEAFFYLGEMHEKGNGVAKNLVKAKDWYKKGAEKGDESCKKAMQRLINTESAEDWYWDAETAYSEKDYEEAARLYRKAAKAGNADAASELAIMYLNGVGVPKDRRNAGQWFLRAAKLGDSFAQNEVGEILYKKKHYASASDWYYKAGKNGYPRGFYNLAWCYHYGGESNSATGISCNFEQAIMFYKECEAKTHDEDLKYDCQYRIGQCYEFGYNNIPEARIWYQKAAREQYEPAVTALQQMEMVEKDRSGAEAWFHKGEQAYWNITVETFSGMRITCLCPSWNYDRYTEAKRWWHKAAMHGHPQAQYNLARYVYQQGNGSFKSQTLALEWFTKSAERGYLPAQEVLVKKYKYGEGTHKDLETSLRWERRARQNQ